MIKQSIDLVDQMKSTLDKTEAEQLEHAQLPKHTEHSLHQLKKQTERLLSAGMECLIAIQKLLANFPQQQETLDVQNTKAKLATFEQLATLCLARQAEPLEHAASQISVTKKPAGYRRSPFLTNGRIHGGVHSTALQNF